MTFPQRIAIATRNAHKVREIRAICTDWPVTFVEADDRWPAVEETGTTYLENAFLKATGLVDNPGTILGTEWAVHLGIVYAYLPFMVLPLYAALEKLDTGLLEAAGDLGASPAAQRVADQALAYAGVTVGDIDHFDFYSCFPIAVSNTACDGLGLAHDDPRGLTVTGGLPFFGGPGNNYSMHAIATVLEKLRADPGSSISTAPPRQMGRSYWEI